MTRFDTWLMNTPTFLVVPRIEGHPCMLRHCSTITLASLPVASSKVALSLQGLSLAKSRRKSIFSGNVLVLCKRSSTSPDMVTISRVLLHSLHITSPVVSVCTCVFWQGKQPRIGNNCSQSSKIATLRDLQNSSYPTKVEFNNCFIIHLRYSPFLIGVSPFRSLFFRSPKITQPCPQVFTVNGSVI